MRDAGGEYRIGAGADLGGVADRAPDDDAGNAALLGARHHHLADDGVVEDAARVDHDDVAGARRVERLVDEEVVARRGLHRISGSRELAFLVHRPQLRAAGVEPLHAVGKMRRHHLRQLGDQPRIGPLRDIQDAHRGAHAFLLSRLSSRG